MTDKLIAAFMVRWKVFLLTFIIQFLLTALLRFGFESPEFLNFLSFSNLKISSTEVLNPVDTQNLILEQIKTKLEQKPNQLQFKKETSLIPTAYAASNYDLSSGYIVVDLNNSRILAEKNSQQKLPVASLTKIMTAVISLDLASQEEIFTVSPKATKVIPTSIGVVSGQKMNLGELLNALLLTSANDSAEVIKNGINQKYGADIFVAAMNEKAKFLGLKNTHFDNPQGYDGKNNYSSAFDLAVLSYYALANYPQIKEISQKDYQYLKASKDHKQFDLYNWNGLLGVYPGIYGLKIGNTGKAGYTTIVVSEREGKRVLVVLLGSPGVLERDLWAAQLLDLGFNRLGIKPANISEKQLKAKYSTWKYWG